MLRAAAVAAMVAGCTHGQATSPDAVAVDAAEYVSPPQLVNARGMVVASPIIVPVYFANETQQAQTDSFIAAYAASKVFTTQLAEYGVGLPTVAPSVVVPLTVTSGSESAIDEIMQSELNGTDQAFGPRDEVTLATTIFLVVLPNGPASTALCNESGVVHDSIPLASGDEAHLAIAAQCNATFDERSLAIAYAIVAAATDPVVGGAPVGWYEFDAGHAAFDVIGTEVPNVCAGTTQVAGAAVPRLWSNAEAGAGHDPCMPAAPGPYFNSFVQNTTVVTRGQTSTVEVLLFSDGDVPGGWTVAAASSSPNPASLTFVDRASGNAGDVLHLAIGAAENASYVITSTTGGVEQYWYGQIVVQ